MPTATLPHFDCTGTFQNIVATIPAAGNVNVEIQNVGDADVEIIAKASGGAPDPSTTTGLILRPREVYNFNAAQLWVRSRGGRDSRVSLTTT
jgi:hypothetical protein